MLDVHILVQIEIGEKVRWEKKDKMLGRAMKILY